MLKRLFDLIASIVALLLLLPLLLFITILIIADTSGGVLYKQERIGKNGIPFYLYKFRTMKVGSDKKGLLTIGNRDSRTTKIGYFLRKYKLDELPQLLNILKNEMSVVGPRPEVPKYVQLYSSEQKEVLKVKPGLTDLASIRYFHENKLLGEAKDPEKTYIEVIMPEKLALNLLYIEKQNFWMDIKIIWKTIFKILA